MPKQRGPNTKVRPGLKMTIRLRPTDATRFLDQKADENLEHNADFGRKLILDSLKRREQSATA